MKKILSVILLIMAVFLTSCTKEDNTKRVDNPDATIAAALNLESVKNGKLLKEIDETKDDYYSITVSSNLEESLITYNSMLDTVLENAEGRAEALSVMPLTFIQLTEAEKASVIYEAYSDLGLKAVNFTKFELKTLGQWNHSFTDGVKDLQNAYLDGQRNNALSIIYLPCHVKHYVEGKAMLEAYVLLPVYFEITKVENNTVSNDLFNSFAKPQISFNENNFLPSAIEE